MKPVRHTHRLNDGRTVVTDCPSTHDVASLHSAVVAESRAFAIEIAETRVRRQLARALVEHFCASKRDTDS